MVLPRIIQGGMGAGVSNWQLARAVSKRGQLGVVSGTALDLICARRLQDGDQGGAVRRALEAFPDQEMATRIRERFFLPGGRSDRTPFAPKAMVGHAPSAALVELMVIANFVEVWLAKEGHDGTVGINYLDKIQAPLLPSLYGAMLAKVDVVTVGAGVPKAISPSMQTLARGEKTEVELYISRTNPDFRPQLSFDPSEFFQGTPPQLPLPSFLPIVASAVLAARLMKSAGGPVAGFVVETPKAGGHNAPPRGWRRGDGSQEPVYGKRDEIDFEKLGQLGVPFWLAGAFGHPGGLQEARDLGAHGIQIGTLFAFCDESGLTPEIKRRVILESRQSTLEVFTDPIASPTGFPFKVLQLEGTNSETGVVSYRKRVCDLGYLREAYETPSGKAAWRCPAEPLDTWEKKGGQPEDAAGRKCLCNGLMANIGMPQLRSDGTEELPLVTAGDDAAHLAGSLCEGTTNYRAEDVIHFLLGDGALIGSQTAPSERGSESDDELAEPPSALRE